MSGLDNRAYRDYLKLCIAILALLVSLPIQLKGLSGIYVWLSPFVFLDRSLALRSVVWMHIGALLVLLFCFWKRKVFCRYICPVGWICNRIARCSSIREKTGFRRPGISLALFALGMALTGVSLFAVFDPLILLRTFFSALFLPFNLTFLCWGSVIVLIMLSNLIWPQGWCRSLCPLGGFQDWIYTACRKPDSLLSRRVWLSVSLGMAAGWLIRSHSRPKASGFRPPSALPDEAFYTACLRCGNCVQACPSGIIRLTYQTKSVWEWMTPTLDFSAGYCWADCHACGQVCPGGALRPFSVSEKRQFRIGTAQIHTATCQLTQYKECDRCKAVCSFQAIRIVSEHLSAKVVIDPSTCTGCGACMQICPENAIRILPLS